MNTSSNNVFNNNAYNNNDPNTNFQISLGSIPIFPSTPKDQSTRGSINMKTSNHHLASSMNNSGITTSHGINLTKGNENNRQSYLKMDNTNFDLLRLRSLR
jgi:hypothetical protein